MSGGGLVGAVLSFLWEVCRVRFFFCCVRGSGWPCVLGRRGAVPWGAGCVRASRWSGVRVAVRASGCSGRGVPVSCPVGLAWVARSSWGPCVGFAWRAVPFFSAQCDPQPDGKDAPYHPHDLTHSIASADLSAKGDWLIPTRHRSRP